MDEALFALSAEGDSQSQQRALVYFEQLKASADGWKLCANALTSGAYDNNDRAKFFCFQIIEHYLKTSYSSSDQNEQSNIKSLLLTWLQLQTTKGKDKGFIRNKAAQIFALAFVVDYPRRWPTFFTDLLQALQLGDVAVDMYLRILKAIDSEVVDREIAHTQEETERNTVLKDTMRENIVPQLVDSWYQILTTYETSDPELTCQALEVVGAYVSWIDISLIANDKFVPVLLKFMSNTLLRECACDCIHEIISKGMDPIAKAKLIESFMTLLNNAGIFNIQEDEEGDYLAKLSKLVNGIGIQLITGWQKCAKAQDAENCSYLINMIEDKVPLMFRFLGHEDDDVSEYVSQFAHDYVSILKQIPNLRPQQSQNVKDLLLVIIKKMKYDDSYSFESEGEEEAMFQDYRKELKVIFNNIGALDGKLVTDTVNALLVQTMSQWRNMNYPDVEIAITMFYMLAEATASPVGLLFSGDSERATAFQEMMRTLVNSGVSFHGHPLVVLQFFETVARYDKFFNQEPQYLPDVLTAILDERGLRSRAPQLASRSAYLFSRIVKDINKQHFHGFLEEILKQIWELLVVNSPDNGTQYFVSTDDQMFLYETAGILIIQSQFPPEKKQSWMKQLLAPIVTKFDGFLRSMIVETDEKRKLEFAQCLCQAMAFASRTSKGFSNQQTMKQCGCVEAYTETLQVFLHALDTPVHRQILHAGVRQFMHRMVVCLESEILPFIPIAMENLLKNPEAKELHDFIPFINQVISKFKKQIVPFLQEVFMPIVTTIFRVLSAPIDDRDQVAAAEKNLLRRSYFSFISTVVNNNVTEVLSTQDSNNLKEVLMTVIQGAVEIPDPQGQKTCFAICKKLVEVWGGKDGLSGFEEFIFKHIVPACFMAPMKPTFDLADGQTILVLNECAGCLKAAVDKQGDVFLQYLQTDYLPTLNMAPEMIQEFCMALKSDEKVFKKYFKSFFTRAKS